MLKRFLVLWTFAKSLTTSEETIVQVTRLSNDGALSAADPVHPLDFQQVFDGMNYFVRALHRRRHPSFKRSGKNVVADVRTRCMEQTCFLRAKRFESVYSQLATARSSKECTCTKLPSIGNLGRQTNCRTEHNQTEIENHCQKRRR